MLEKQYHRETIDVRLRPRGLLLLTPGESKFVYTSPCQILVTGEYTELTPAPFGTMMKKT